MKRGNHAERPQSDNGPGRHHERVAGRRNHWVRQAKHATDRSPWARAYSHDFYDLFYLVRHRSRPSLLSNGGKP